MPEQPKPAAETPKAPRRYFIVNPKGAIHEVSREHARERLAKPGWRMASAAEIEIFATANGNQVADKPLCARWSPDPDVQLDEAA